MDVSQLPFNQLIGLELAAQGSGFLVTLPDAPQYANHLGTVHASALLAVAEAGSGAFLLQQFGAGVGYIPVVRRVEAKFRKAASGQVRSRCSVKEDELARWSVELSTCGRVIASIPVEVLDASGVVVVSAVVEWFIAKAGVDVSHTPAPIV